MLRRLLAAILRRALLECCECGRYVSALSPGHRCYVCEFSGD